jgi:hypothetical protein
LWDTNYHDGDGDEKESVRVSPANRDKYCHCEPLVLRPQGDVVAADDDVQLLTPIPNTDDDKSRKPIGGYIVYDLTEDGEETTVSSKIEEEARHPVRVEVRVDGRVGTERDDGGAIPTHRSRADSSRTSQRTKKRPVSPAPDGFDRNHGHHYVPFRIPTADGRKMMTAKWVRVRMGVNPTVKGCAHKGGVVYLGEVHARPEYDQGATPDYTHQQLHHFRSDYTRRHEVDEVLERIRDKSLTAEVARY